ncbi:aminotransferase class V-fold PLP-dependent enzyme [Mycoplasmopsis anatis]|uniref:Aminotransferase class V-fold PLP-dependent enzyme n=1 Tax=Mycoplasmopsis anatis TaxID=171279 RepID=A0A9Q3L6M8_9BACT|nr:aminotransferase class V-fold PLP-dependent enzyme [Mycoplasmopsis anatis]MBW0594856.1 aminotransferase class V-fold PLP-dependent enzyme [Mycoplasmopsis anatis]MBW0595637.1 aminotransferase class V-fold PLP-dependent enzyme [Mycoplasmopsis anatis]MBW0595983.1 aminotransferase class V-fold PLP-dependent enzyme [Mycoplasmopsis anatis]MBW0596702.1 aminotransferase class V-fold PLP-dependent enzyme [Mycoplasmopsis anatis]MBW0597365.1 aminotransferase class V-fold PLP-dependent enzyme [Mycoplas
MNDIEKLKKEIREEFPILNNIVYFDNAAQSLKPVSAIEAIKTYYTYESVSVRTGDTPLGNKINQIYKQTKQKIAELINSDPEQIIYTSGTTDSLNTFALMFSQIIQPNKKILISAYNHSSNMLPWIELAKSRNIQFEITEEILDKIDDNVQLICLSQSTNNFDVKYNIEEIYTKAQKFGAIVLNDAAQSITHEKVDQNYADVIAFSTNKLLGPSGLGILAIKKDLLKKIRPTRFGGGSVHEIAPDGTWIPKETIQAFEPGTPNIAAIYMFNKSLDLFLRIGYDNIQKILLELSNYLYEKLSKLKNVEIYSKKGSIITLFNIKNINAQDVATYLGTKNIYVNAGIFCAPFVRNIKSERSYVRVSLAIYNNFGDIDKLVNEIKNGGDFYGF